ncbi:hypothetical protein L484_000511 [Morus notabilis]|uniref:F-box/LRR-repeat protein 15/At3g58940/PEG3-like LRR domain-containing protein n=1 Tax=Morus notabilis TaxID=981085 RepID=W9SDV6_9ROSA|nr:hypothetical protein L484_000511 [Morus notabilis]
MKAYFEDHTAIDYWLAILLSSSQLKELDLCIRKHTPIQMMYSFPFDASGLTSLTSLKLCGVRILKPHTTSINLPKLVSLALEKVETNDVELNNLLIGFSSLEKLLLKECANLVNPRVLNSTLKFLEIVYGATQPSNPRRRPLETTFHVESVNLQSFAYNRAPYYSNLLLSCGIIQHLLFSNMRFRDQWFEDLIFRLPLLQNLSVCNCKFEQIQVFSQHLKHFVFKGNKRGYALAARINTPNLVSFSFEGDFLSNFLMIAPNILQADIQLRSPKAYDTQWYFSLCDFLRYVDGSKMVSLGIHSEEALIFPREFRRNSWLPLPTLKHLKVTTDLPLSSEAELRRALLWTSPSLETLLIEQNQ